MSTINESIPSHRHILETFITQSDGKQIIGHQIESFNQFMEVDIPEVIHMANPITSYGSPEIPLAGPRSALATATGLSTSAANALMGTTADGSITGDKKVKHEYEVTIEFEKISIRKPTIFENNGAIHPMMPNDARLRNLTYASPLNVDVKVTTTFIDHTRNSIRESNVRIFPNVHLGKVPVMVGSKYCLLHDQKHIHPSKMGECPEDLGGYFIIQGGERAMISMERMSENRPFVFRNGRGNAKEMEVVEIKCIGPDNDQVPKSNTIKIVYHPKNQLILMLRATVPRIKTDIPLIILFRALGVLADKDIYELIVGYDNDPTYDHIITESILEASSITTQEQALLWLAEHTNTWSMKSHKQNTVHDSLSEELFPHIGGSDMNYEKACFLAHMTRKVLWTSSKRLPTDDRDGYSNKRVDIPGFLLADLFRKTYNNRMVKDMKAALSKEIHGGSWKATGNWTEIVNINNINKIIKSTILDVCLKSSLATGSFGSGKIGGPSKIGVSQVLNRLNYTSAISHLRRISTPIEKTGKLIAPRKQHNSQWGFVCPCETPEGHGVGVIKNMASTTAISIFGSPITIYAFIQNLDKLIPLRNTSIQQKHDNTRVFLNGSWIGILLNEDAVEVVDALRNAKRSGKIHIHTGIIWKNSFKELWITSEAGRVIRPVYYAPTIREIAADKTGTLKQQILDIKEWNQLLFWETPTEKHLFEYLDAGESEGAYIAMDYDTCVKDNSYTHCEIHPSVIFGTAASGIPFPDHNQSPRNAYQCLGVDEKVRMANGTEKRIADVKIGDKVITFNPNTMEMTTTSVCNQYVRSTDKQIYTIKASGNRTLIATEDHKLMTNHGWTQVKDIIPGIHLLGVMAEPTAVPDNTSVATIILSENRFRELASNAGIHESMINAHVMTLTASNLLPLSSNDMRVQILARMVGFASSDGSLNVFTKYKTINNTTYIYSLPQFQAHFGSKLAAERFEEDVHHLNIPRVGVRESHREFNGSTHHTYSVCHNGALPSLLVTLGTTMGKKTDVMRLPVPEWIMNGSQLIKREFLGGFQGGDGCKFRTNIIKNYVTVTCNTTSQQSQPTTVSSLRSFFEQIVTLFQDVGIQSHMLENKKINDMRIEVRYILQASRQNLLNFWDKIGFRYDTFKQHSSAVIAELIREVGSENIIRPEVLEQWKSTCYSMGGAVFVPIKKVLLHPGNIQISDITVLHDNHSFITTGGILSSNCAMGKQAMGIYSLNFRERFDAMSHILCYPEIPMVSPYMSKFYGAQSLPAGQNIVVAIMTYTGYNQEDSNMINRGALDRGRYRSIFYRTYKDEERKNQSSGEEEKFCNPDSVETKHMKNAHYEKLAEDGFVPKDQFVTPDDVLIGKVVPLRVATGAVLPAGAKKQRDVSKMPRNNESGYVDKVYKNRNGEGYSFVKIRVRKDRIPEIGDKFSSRHGQKGTMGMILNPEDMPQTASGIIPDIIINPHCLAEDHEILTEKGFMNWQEVEKEYNSGILRIAGYNHENGELVYEKPTAFILNDAMERDMIEFTHSGEAHRWGQKSNNKIPSNGVSLFVTTDHDMYAKKGKMYGDGVVWDGIQKGSRGSVKRIAYDYEKYKAQLLLPENENDTVKFIGKARSGVTGKINAIPFVKTLKLTTSTKIVAFCELYGYWLGDGCLRFGGNSIEMSPVKTVDDEWLRKHFTTLELEQSVDYTYNVIGNNPIRYRWSIINKEWFNVFCSEYGKKYAKYANSNTAPEVTTTIESENIKSAKWMAPWVWDLSCSLAQSIITGLRFADGCEKADRNLIWTSSARFRDEIMRLALHAGYSAHFGLQHSEGDYCGTDIEGRPIIAKHDNWKISYTNTSRGSEPVLNASRDIKKTTYNGRTWCVTMPHGFIITRRAIRNQNNVVIQASRPIITGQCIPSRMTIAQLMETLLSKIGCMTGCLGDGSPFNATTVEDLSAILRDKYGMEPHGNEIMYNGYTGRMMETSIFVGPCYYQRLRHCAADKQHSRASGPLVMLTRQPAEGRARDGGLRFGEMERDCVVAHGMAEFTKERLMECSDMFSCYSCKNCGLLAIANPEQSIWACRGCGNTTEFSHINIPYATKLLLQELETMNLSSRLITQQKLICNGSLTK